MKNARVVFIVFGIALLMLAVAPYVSAQGVTGWFQGKSSMKGYEVSGTGAIVGKAGTSATIYVNIADDTLNNQYLVTTCIQDEGVWHLGVSTTISKLFNIYGDPNTAMIWDFADDSELNFYQNIYTYPMFYVKISKSGANFKSFSCGGWDNSISPNFQLGPCSVTFKTVDPAKVPTSCFPPSPFQGTLDGSWSGTCASTPVSGTFSVNIDGIGKVTGSYSGIASGSILGLVDVLGNYNAKGVAGGASWAGQLTLPSGGSFSGTGTWWGTAQGSSCSGTWSGSGTTSP